MKDSFNRTIDYLRISVTDQCNERCMYCMPEHPVRFLPQSSILSFDEIVFIAEVCAKKGIKRIRLTGGEPLIRKNIPVLVKRLKSIPGIEKVLMTTNGIELSKHLKELKEAGLDGVNISLDAVDEDLYAKITRRPESMQSVKKILAVIQEAQQISDFSVKINCVPLGLNDDQLIPIARLAQKNKISVRFIELMPMGFAVETDAQFRSNETIFSLLEQEFGKLKPAGKDRYPYFSADSFKGKIGFISPVTHPFCSECSRLRLTADGYVKSCLEFKSKHYLRPLLSKGLNEHTAQQIGLVIDEEILQKPRGNCFLNTSLGSRIPDEIRYMNQIGG